MECIFKALYPTLEYEGLWTDNDDDKEALAEADTGEETWGETEAETGAEDTIVDWR